MLFRFTLKKINVRKVQIGRRGRKIHLVKGIFLVKTSQRSTAPARTNDGFMTYYSSTSTLAYLFVVCIRYTQCWSASDWRPYVRLK